MEKEVQSLFNDTIIQQGSQLFKLTYESLVKLDGFENYVFSGEKDGKDYILRFTHSSHRSKGQIEAELNWLQYLHKNGAPVAGPLASINSQFVEPIKAGETTFFVSLFEKAPGAQVKNIQPQFNEKLFYLWGKAIGKLHRLTTNYTEVGVGRPDAIKEFHQQLVPYIEDSEVEEKTKKIVTEIEQLPKEKNHCQLIHSDVHHGNFFYDEDKGITIFDFDDCCYHHFISDIAIPIYYSVWRSEKDIATKSAFINEQFLPSFLKGYLEEHSLDKKLLALLPLFLKFRDCELYAVLKKKLDLPALGDAEKKLIHDIRERIIAEAPIISLQLDQLTIG